MPSRWTCLLIFASWLATMSWLFYRDIWPWLQPDIPPPYTIDLVDEARQQHQAQIPWNVYLERDRPIPRFPAIRAATMLSLAGLGPALHPGSAGLAVSLDKLSKQTTNFQAKTWVEYQEREDSFEFHMQLASRITPLGTRPQLDLGTIKLEYMKSSYKVNRMGQLKEMEVKFIFEASLFGLAIKGAEVWLGGEVIDEQFRARYKIHPPNHFPLPAEALKLLEGETEPVKLSHNGSILLPLHPVNRIRGLHPGQKWRMPLVNPVEEALSRSSPLPIGHKPRLLAAHVLPNTQLLPDTEESIRCLVIEYDDEDLRPRTWVQESTGLVLRQEVAINGDQRLIMQRDVIPLEQ
jgi:hypothetical protein